MFYPPLRPSWFQTNVCFFVCLFVQPPQELSPPRKVGFKQKCIFLSFFLKQIYIFRDYSLFIFLFNLLWTWILVLGSISNKFISSPSLSCWVVHNPLGRFALPSLLLRINFFKSYIFLMFLMFKYCRSALLTFQHSRKPNTWIAPSCSKWVNFCFEI